MESFLIRSFYLLCYITFDSLENAAKALNLNINKEKIKNGFKKVNGYINLEKLEKLILDENTEDINSNNSKFMSKKSINKIKRNSTFSRKKSTQI